MLFLSNIWVVVCLMNPIVSTDRGGVETLIQLDMCEKSLTRDMKEYSDTKYGGKPLPTICV